MTDPTDVAAAVAQPAVDPFALMPANTFGVVRVDVAQLRSSPYVQIVLDWIREAEPLGEGREAKLDAILNGADTAFFAISEDDLGSVVFSGDFAEGELDSAIQGLGTFQRGQVAGREAMVSSDAALVTLDARTYLLAPSSAAPGLLMQTTRPARLNEQAFTDVSDRVGMSAGTFRFAGVACPCIRDTLVRKIPGMTAALAESIVSYGASAEASNGIQGEVVVTMSDADSAQQLATIANDLLGQIGGNIALRAMGLGDVLAGISTRVEGNTVVGAVNLDDQTVRDTLQRVRAFALLALQAMAERVQQQMGSTAAPAPMQ